MSDTHLLLLIVSSTVATEIQVMDMGCVAFLFCLPDYVWQKTLFSKFTIATEIKVLDGLHGLSV